MQRPTLKTIASEMNLSVSAVSRIINGKGKSIGLNEDTINSTLTFANKIGYRPHKQAQSLRLGKTNTIGVIISLSEVNNSDLSYRLFKGISKTARQKSQTLMFFDVVGTKSALDAIDQCLNLGVDGIIATHLNSLPYLTRLNKVIKQKIQVIMLLNLYGFPMQCPNIVVDQRHGGFVATDFLIKKGYKRIAHISNCKEFSSGIDRFKGYKQALAESGIPFDEELIFEDSENKSESVAKEILKLKKLPEAVFSWSDRTAVKADHIFRDAGANIEIIGFDNREFIQYLKKPFNSINYPMEEVGILAVNTLLEGDTSKRILTLYPEIVKYN